MLEYAARIWIPEKMYKFDKYTRELFFLFSLFLTHIVFQPLLASTDSPAIVTTTKLENVIFFPKTSIPAKVISLLDSDISSDINGKITSLEFEVGNEIDLDVTLAQIDCADYMSEKNQAENNLGAAIAEKDLISWQLDRAIKLAKQQNLSQEEVQKLRSSINKIDSNINSFKAVLEHASNQVSRCKVKAPFSGIITEKYVSLGEYVRSGTPIYKLLNTHELEVEAEVHHDEIQSMVSANSITFSLNENIYPLQIRTVLPQQNPNTKMQVVRLSFLGKRPVPGASGRVNWIAQKPKIPVEYIQHINKDFGIFLLDKNEDGTYSAKFHKLHNAVEGQAGIIDLPLSTDIIVKGRERLSDMEHVKKVSDE